MSFLIPPNKAQLEYIEKEDIYRSSAELEEDVTQLIEWLSKQPHLPNVTDRKWLLRFITGCKYSLQKSKKVIESYFIARAEHPEFYGSYTEEQLNESIKQGTVSIFPRLTPECYRVVGGKSTPVPEDFKFKPSVFAKAYTTLLDLQLKEEPVCGNIFLMDLKHFRMSDFMTFTPAVTKTMIKCFLNSFPLRMKSIHFVNPPMFVSTLVSFFKMFVPNKIKERFFVHDSLETLYQYIPKDVLPDIYGGLDGSIENIERNNIELLMSNKEWLDERPKADLSKLPKHVKSDELEMNGTFKKLQID